MPSTLTTISIHFAIWLVREKIWWMFWTWTELLDCKMAAPPQKAAVNWPQLACQIDLYARRSIIEQNLHENR